MIFAVRSQSKGFLRASCLPIHAERTTESLKLLTASCANIIFRDLFTSLPFCKVPALVQPESLEAQLVVLKLLFRKRASNMFKQLCDATKLESILATSPAVLQYRH